ncbi:hypothetical protein [Agromyces allii]|uniref:Uncharacterized protein n=1 Tax=Agromyces allii TaxID=393607 RepID=A0ABN2QBB2_9MICO|nr:hypothetical protein [Agromyces allii]
MTVEVRDDALLSDAVFEASGAGDRELERLVTWVRHRYGLLLAPVDAIRLLGEDPTGNTLRIDGREVMIGTPASNEPGDGFALVEPGTRTELAVRRHGPPPGWRTVEATGGGGPDPRRRAPRRRPPRRPAPVPVRDSRVGHVIGVVSLAVTIGGVLAASTAKIAGHFLPEVFPNGALPLWAVLVWGAWLVAAALATFAPSTWFVAPRSRGVLVEASPEASILHAFAATAMLAVLMLPGKQGTGHLIPEYGWGVGLGVGALLLGWWSWRRARTATR